MIKLDKKSEIKLVDIGAHLPIGTVLLGERADNQFLVLEPMIEIEKE